MTIDPLPRLPAGILKKVWNNCELLDRSYVYLMDSEIGAEGEPNVPFLQARSMR
jgi:hypothetical protein